MGSLRGLYRSREFYLLMPKLECWKTLWLNQKSKCFDLKCMRNSVGENVMDWIRNEDERESECRSILMEGLIDQIILKEFG